MDGDGFITREEMENWLASAFAVVLQADVTTEGEDGEEEDDDNGQRQYPPSMHPAELAAVTAVQCFDEADQVRLPGVRQWPSHAGSTSPHLVLLLAGQRWSIDSR